MAYIDRELALSHPFANGQYDHEHANEHFIFGFESYKEWLEQLPTADVQEVKHGNWVGIDDEPCETFECDRCGFVLEDWIQGAFYNFCPNCGADMRERSEE